MLESIYKAFEQIKEDYSDGLLSKNEVKERLEGVLLLAKIQLENQPDFDIIYTPALKVARNILLNA